MGQVGIAVQTAVIASGGSLSAAISPGAGVILAILMPAAWTTANLTFQGSPDGVTYGEVFESVGGTAVTAIALVSQFVTIPSGLRGCSWLKIRSGTSGSPTAQGARRELLVVIEKFPT